MNDIFKEMINEGWVVIYMNDILIFSDNLEEHRKWTQQVLQRLMENDLYLKLEKCAFEITEVDFLGLIVKENYLGMDPTKLKGIAEWPTSGTVKAVRSFLGFGNFYRRFIQDYSTIARSLNDLTKKNHKFEWTEECQQAFNTLKARFLKAPVLLMPDNAKPFLIECDTSKYATGAVLHQRDVNGDWKTCGCISQSFNAAQYNYEIYDCELLSVVRALETWHHYLQESSHPITVLSNHKNLTYFRTAQKLNR